MYSRVYAKWLDREYISVNRTDYVDLYNTKTVYVEPWSDRVYLDGTDAF